MVTPATIGAVIRIVDNITVPTACYVSFSYWDANQRYEFLIANITITELVGDADNALESGEQWLIGLAGLEAGLTPDLGPSTSFVVEVKPEKGAVLTIARTTPPVIDPVNDLL